MKLLGWMPRKLKQHSVDTLKNFTLGNSCTCLLAKALLDEQQCYHQPIMSQNSPIGVKVNRDEEVDEEEGKSSITNQNLFHGFLAIGTLGSEPITTEPTTPKFSISLENVIEKETEVTDNELKLINYEVDKFLEAETEEASNESSERSSYASIITLSSKQIEVVQAEENENMVVCPLQGYLFGSLIELPKMGVALKKEKTSLEELFKNDKLGSEQQMGGDKGENKFSKGIYGTDFMKMMFKKLRSSSKSSTVSVIGDAAADTVSNKRKLPKVLRMFHRKIHPEKSSAEKKFTKSQKYEMTNNPYDSGYSKGDLTFKDNSTGKGEHWINTDADYVVLEL